MSTLPTIPNINTAVLEQLLSGQSGQAFNQTWYLFIQRQLAYLQAFASPPIDVQQNAGALMNGGDDTAAFQNGIQMVMAQGGGILTIPQGKLSSYNVSIPTNAPPIWIMGRGMGITTLERRGALKAGQGLIDVNASNFSLSDLTVEGNTTTSVGLQYGVGFTGVTANDPMASSLTNNTSLWIHGNTTSHSIQRVQFQHSGGYSILLDARSGGISDADIVGCAFQNNRPTLFGTTPGQLIYGSWNGGILAMGDGRTSAQQVVSDLLVTQCRFYRNNGNCVWSALYGLNALHSAFRIIGNYFLDCGLDGIEMGGVSGGAVEGNVLRRVGYVCVNDTSQSIPRWLANLNATAIDSSGLVKGVNYSGNSIASANGGAIDLDGHSFSALTGNVCRIPYSYEPEFEEDSIAISGASNSGSTAYGVNLNNTSQSEAGATNIEISSNQFINLPSGSLRLYGGRRIHVTGNNIEAPSPSFVPPIAMGPVGPGPYQRCYDNKITGNNIDYDTVGGAPPAIFEDNTFSAFLGSEQNTVYNNNPITPTGTSAIEFEKSPTSGSVVYSGQVWFP